MTQDMFPIDGRGRTFNAQGVEVKLSPAMQSLVRALNAHGYVDPIRDFGRIGFGGSGRVGISTVVALMDRGILRESRTSRGVHFPATTPAQVEHEAYDENDRIIAERAAHAADQESWVQAIDDDSTAEEIHVRMRRDGSQVRILSTGFRYWRVYFPGQQVSMSANGTSREARAAADRYERNDAHAGALAEDRARTETSPEHRAARKADSAAYQRELARELGLKVKGDPKPEGWGQPDGMLSASTEPVWTPTVGDTVLYRANNPKYGRGRALGRVLLVDGINIKVQWPGGVDWHHATALEHHPMPSDGLVRAELEAQMPEVHAFGRDMYAAASAAACDQLGTVRGPADLVTCPACRELLAQRAQTPAEAEAAIAALTQDPHEYPAPYAMGPTSRAAQAHTPAEARTGVSDRAAAALADDMTALRRYVKYGPDTVREASDMLLALDRVEAALRGGR